MTGGMVLNADSVGLDEIFGALSDSTRRDILRRVAIYRLSVGEIVKDYHLTFAAVSKHLKVLEKAGFIVKHKVGRRHYIQPAPLAFKDAAQWLEYYKSFWESNLDSLANYIDKEAM